MKFTVNDKEYFVKWEYINSERTLCVIYDNSTSYNDPLVVGEAKKVKKDRFCKNTGRKISLDRALNQLFPYHTGQKARAIAWAEYFNESPKRLK